ncbi:transglutaminase domain-containing protein [bacterium]|nr:transglutaminase domain-containing protein [bacterium]
MSKKKKTSQDYSEVINILVFILLVVVFLGAYIAGAQKGGLKDIFIKTEKAYLDKADDMQAAKKTLAKKEPQKIQIPYEKFSFVYNYTINVKGNAQNVTFKSAIPKDENEKQYISQLQLSPKPVRTYTDGVNNIAEFRFDNVKNQTVNVIISGIATQRTYDYDTAKFLNKNPEKERNLTQYLTPARLIESNDPLVVKTAQQLKGQTQKETVDKTFAFVQKNLKYNINSKTIGAKDVLKVKQGKCMEYANLMVALLRANKVPARYVVGNMITDSKSGRNMGHAWLEVYYEDYGWVAYDPTVIALPLYYKDVNGNTKKQTMEVNPSSSLGRKYIASSRNMETAFVLGYQAAGNVARPQVSFFENTKITKIE